jgi:hypothetical protein
MQVRDLDHWNEFLRELESLEHLRGEHQRTVTQQVSELLYRGHSDASWQLQTSLERAVGRDVKDTEYLQRIKIIKPEIEAFTNRAWSEKIFDDELEKFRNLPWPPPAYEYMAYLRHHGFPSPLLDWTASAFVAAYLAFREFNPKVEGVAIYAYLENAGAGKVICLQEPSVRHLGPTITTHRRHFLQQSHYTICVRKSADNELIYCSHEDAFNKTGPDQDRRWKFTLPMSERKAALAYLQKFNVTGFSLFGSEESLMESLAIREFVIRG